MEAAAVAGVSACGADVQSAHQRPRPAPAGIWMGCLHGERLQAGLAQRDKWVKHSGSAGRVRLRRAKTLPP
jgi:hypothetical protein